MLIYGNLRRNKCQAKFDTLKHSCPTLSPFATCGDRLFKCGDNNNFFTFALLTVFKKEDEIAIFNYGKLL